MKLLIATTNPGKARDMQQSLAGLRVTVLTLRDLDQKIDAPIETGSTFLENATAKAQHYFEYTGIPTVADDSGLIVEALQYELGVHTRRWGAGPEATDQEWIEFFLKRMSTESNRNARFVSHVAYMPAADVLHTFEGECLGIITETLESDYHEGVPLTACFKPLGSKKVFAAHTVEEKNKISHRGQAMAAFRAFLEKKIKAMA